MAQQYKSYRVALTATASTSGGAVASIANPEGQRLIIRRAILDVQTASNGAASVDVGVGSSASTSYDNLIDGCSVATAGSFDNFATNGQAGTNGKSTQVWAAANFVTVTGSATTAGLAGYLMLDYELTASES